MNNNTKNRDYLNFFLLTLKKYFILNRYIYYGMQQSKICLNEL